MLGSATGSGKRRESQDLVDVRVGISHPRDHHPAPKPAPKKPGASRKKPGTSRKIPGNSRERLGISNKKQGNSSKKCWDQPPALEKGRGGNSRIFWTSRGAFSTSLTTTHLPDLLPKSQNSPGTRREHPGKSRDHPSRRFPKDSLPNTSSWICQTSSSCPLLTLYS